MRNKQNTMGCMRNRSKPQTTTKSTRGGCAIGKRGEPYSNKQKHTRGGYATENKIRGGCETGDGSSCVALIITNAWNKKQNTYLLGATTSNTPSQSSEATQAQ